MSSIPTNLFLSNQAAAFLKPLVPDFKEPKYLVALAVIDLLVVRVCIPALPTPTNTASHDVLF
jgi:hypothetical protein